MHLRITIELETPIPPDGRGTRVRARYIGFIRDEYTPMWWYPQRVSVFSGGYYGETLPGFGWLGFYVT